MPVKLTNEKSVPRAWVKLAAIAVAGIAVGGLTAGAAPIALAAIVAWDTVAVLFVAVTWAQVSQYGPDLVKKHATREDPSRVVSDAILLVASIASLGAVALILVNAKGTPSGAQISSTTLAVISVMASWLMVHTLYALRYAELYYTAPTGGVDFGDTKTPVYADFAYLAFTMGMTYQVSDTSLKSREFRSMGLRHALLAYLLGTVIIATTINLVAGLGK